MDKIELTVTPNGKLKLSASIGGKQFNEEFDSAPAPLSAAIDYVTKAMKDSEGDTNSKES